MADRFVDARAVRRAIVDGSPPLEVALVTHDDAPETRARFFASHLYVEREGKMVVVDLDAIEGEPMPRGLRIGLRRAEKANGASLFVRVVFEVESALGHAFIVVIIDLTRVKANPEEQPLPASWTATPHL